MGIVKENIIAVLSTIIVTTILVIGISFAYFSLSLGGKIDSSLTIITDEVDADLEVTKSCDLTLQVMLDDMKQADGTASGVPIEGNNCNLTAAVSTASKVTCRYKTNYIKTSTDNFVYSLENTTNKPESVLNINRTAASGATVSSSAPTSPVDITNKSTVLIDEGTISFAAGSTNASLSYDVMPIFKNYNFTQNINAGKTVTGKVELDIYDCEFGDEPYDSTSRGTLDKTKFQNFANTNNPTEIIFTNVGASESTVTNISEEADGDIVTWMDGTKMMISTINGGKYIKAPTNCYNLFYSGSATGWQSKLTVLNVDYLDTSNANNMAYMFRDCALITELNLSSFDTSNAEQMYSMFSGCKSIISLDLSMFDTTKTDSIDAMFSNCKALKEVDLSSFSTPRLVYISNLFNECNNLQSVDLSGLITTGVSRMYGVFNNCYSLTSLDLTSFDTSNVTEMNYMFYCCRSLESVDLSSFNTINLDSANSLFMGCQSLVTIDLSSFNTSKLRIAQMMFSGCTSLTNIYVSSLWSKASITYDTDMFLNCNNLYNYKGNPSKAFAYAGGDGYLTLKA